jgi:RNA-directed DNA polymerase
MVVKNRLEAVVDPLFLPASYGYRPKKSALDAVGQARQMCWAYDWVCDLDIKGFFDNLDHGLMMKAVRKHAQERWMELYIERWLKAPAQDEEGNLLKRDKGTPQGGVISPLLANLFLHYAFDLWMGRNWPHLPFERYADDIIVHCRTEREANLVRVKIAAVEAVWVGTASGEDEGGLLQGCQSTRVSSEREVRLSGVYVSTSEGVRSERAGLL